MSLYSSNLQGGLLGPPLSSHTGDKPDPPQPHRASPEVASAHAGLLQPKPAGIFSFYLSFQSWVQRAECCPDHPGPPSPQARITSLVFSLPALSSTCSPTAPVRGVPAPPGVPPWRTSHLHTQCPAAHRLCPAQHPPRGQYPHLVVHCFQLLQGTPDSPQGDPKLPRAPSLEPLCMPLKGRVSG